MIRREIVCDLCGRSLSKGEAVMGFEFANERLNGELFDYTFSDFLRVERHWCGPCLIGVAAMASEARRQLKTIAGQ
jgi:hypothetical protein